VEYYLGCGEWDEAHAIIKNYKLAADLPDLLLRATDELLGSGRVGTLADWIAGSDAAGAPEVELVAAEIAFRRGAYLPAEAHARSAALAFPADHRWLSRAWTRAGQASHFRDDMAGAVECFARARTTASTPTDVKAALWGTFHATVDDDIPTAAKTLESLAEMGSSDPKDVLRHLNGRIALAVRTGPTDATLLDVEAAFGLLDSVDDPFVLTSFLNSASHAFLLAGYFRRALAAAEAELDEARRYDLSFVLPHALARKAMAEIGLTDFAAARCTLRSHADEFEDAYSKVIIAGAWLRLAVAARSLDGVPILSEGVASRASKATYAEYLASLALLHACNEERDPAKACLRKGVLASLSLEPRMIAATTVAVLRLGDAVSAHRSTARLARWALASNCWEPIVCAIRGYPPLLAALVDAHDGVRQPLARIAQETGDVSLGRVLGLTVDRGESSLTPREREVHALLGEGLTNREIARRLYITESTAKVHVRHLMAKLGAETRTAAALRYRSER
jgi:DNA-binding CsgD family transcriptional regulator